MEERRYLVRLEVLGIIGVRALDMCKQIGPSSPFLLFKLLCREPGFVRTGLTIPVVFLIGILLEEMATNLFFAHLARNIGQLWPVYNKLLSLTKPNNQLLDIGKREKLYIFPMKIAITADPIIVFQALQKIRIFPLCFHRSERQDSEYLLPAEALPESRLAYELTREYRFSSLNPAS